MTPIELLVNHILIVPMGCYAGALLGQWIETGKVPRMKLALVIGAFAFYFTGLWALGWWSGDM